MENKELMKKLVEGLDLVEDCETEVGTFKVRPLSLGEKALVKSLTLKAVKITAQGTQDPRGPQDFKVLINMDELFTAEEDVRFIVVAHGLSINDKERITPEQVKRMKTSDKVIKTIYEKVLELSELEDKDLKPFHEQLGRFTAAKFNSDGVQTDEQNK